MFSTIIAGVDGRQGGDDALRLAGLLAGPRTRVVAVTVSATTRGRAAAELVAREAADARPGTQPTAIVASSPSHGLTALAEDLAADVLVLGSAHRGLLGRVLLGNDARSTVHHASCPIALAPRGYARSAPDALRTIGLGYDGSDEAAGALALARRITADAGPEAELRALTVVEIESWIDIPTIYSASAWEAEVDKARRELAALGGLTADAVAGRATTDLLDHAATVDLMVAGLRPHRLPARLLLGSTSEALAARSVRPVLLVPLAPAHVDAEPSPLEVARAARPEPAR